jgi:excisionase family DNA binding protein
MTPPADLELLSRLLSSPESLTEDELLACRRDALALADEAFLRLLRRSQPAREPERDEVLTVEEAARYLRVSPDYLYRHAEELPFVARIGGRLVIVGRQLERWLAAGGDKRLTPAADGTKSRLAAVSRRETIGEIRGILSDPLAPVGHLRGRQQLPAGRENP